LKSEGNLNNEIGLPLTLLQVESAHERAVLEMGMYALGEIRTLAEIARPRIGIVTNVGPTHLERLGTIEHIAVAKSELVQALPSDGWAILNGDDPRVRAMRGQTRAAVQFYGLDAANDVWADEIESLGLEGISFALHRGKESLHVRVPLLGRHSVHTSLAAVCVGLVENLSWDEILHGLQDVAAQLRLVSVPGVRDTTLLDDSYNASPSSTLAALNLLGDLPGRRVAILGDMLELGALEAEGHRVVGYRAAEITDVVIAVGTRGRMIAQAAREVGRAQVIETADNAAAIAAAERVLQPGDFVLVKGSRGMRMEEIVAALSQRAEPEGL
jgi:UDP-N-acetylmuramoyl-tripeptide--D-alanyl-D-alanine ligase